jgi:hypothetical protein
MESWVSEARQQIILRGSWREALKILAWLAVAEIVAVGNSGWSTGVIISLIAFIAFVPALGAELRGLLMVAVVVVVTVVFARLTLDQRFVAATVVYAVLAIGTLAVPMFGGAKIIVDSHGVAVTQLWATRRFAWAGVAPELVSDLSGKRVAVALAPADADTKPYYLSDRYGLSPADLVARMNQLRPV